MISLRNLSELMFKLMSKIGRLAKWNMNVADDRFTYLKFIRSRHGDPGGEDIGTLYEDTVTKLKFVVFEAVFRKDVEEDGRLKKIRIHDVNKVMVVDYLPQELSRVDAEEMSKGLHDPKDREIPIVEELVDYIAADSKKDGSVFNDNRQRFIGRRAWTVTPRKLANT